MGPTRWVSWWHPAWNIALPWNTRYCAAFFAASPQGQDWTLTDFACSLQYFFCLRNHIWMHIVQVLFLPGKWASNGGLYSAIAQGLALPSLMQAIHPIFHFITYPPPYIPHLPLNVLQHEMDFGCDGALQVLTTWRRPVGGLQRTSEINKLA